MDDDQFEDYVGSEQVVEQSNEQVQEEQGEKNYEQQQIVANEQQALDSQIVEDISNPKGYEQSPINHQQYLISQPKQQVSEQIQQQISVQQDEKISSQVSSSNAQQTVPIQENLLIAHDQNAIPVSVQYYLQPAQPQPENQTSESLAQQLNQSPSRQQKQNQQDNITITSNLQWNAFTNSEQKDSNNQNELPNDNFTLKLSQNKIESLNNQPIDELIDLGIPPTQKDTIKDVEFIQSDEVTTSPEVQEMVQNRQSEPNQIDKDEVDVLEIHQTEKFNNQNDNNDAANNQKHEIQYIPEIQQIDKSHYASNQQVIKDQQDEKLQEDDDEFGDFETYQEAEGDTEAINQTTEKLAQIYPESQKLPQSLQNIHSPAYSIPSEQIAKTYQKISEQTIQQPENRHQPESESHNSQNSPQKQTSPSDTIHERSPIPQHFQPVSPTKSLTLQDELLTFLNSLPNYKRICQKSFSDSS